jgi:hypothetical protein
MQYPCIWVRILICHSEERTTILHRREGEVYTKTRALVLCGHDAGAIGTVKVNVFLISIGSLRTTSFTRHFSPALNEKEKVKLSN